MNALVPRHQNFDKGTGSRCGIRHNIHNLNWKCCRDRGAVQNRKRAVASGRATGVSYQRSIATNHSRTGSLSDNSSARNNRGLHHQIGVIRNIRGDSGRGVRGAGRTRRVILSKSTLTRRVDVAATHKDTNHINRGRGQDSRSDTAVRGHQNHVTKVDAGAVCRLDRDLPGRASENLSTQQIYGDEPVRC